MWGGDRGVRRGRRGQNRQGVPIASAVGFAYMLLKISMVSKYE
jgi:hypothetical protein